MQYKAATPTEARANLINRGLYQATSPNTVASRALRPELGDQTSASTNDNHGRDKDSRNSCYKAADTGCLNQVWAHRKSSIPMVWLKPSPDIKVCRETETKAHPEEERPPLPDGRDGLARSFMHSANQDPVNLYRRSVNLETTTVN